MVRQNTHTNLVTVAGEVMGIGIFRDETEIRSQSHDLLEFKLGNFLSNKCTALLRVKTAGRLSTS